MYPEINVTVIETGATVDNIQRMSNKQIDFGMSVMPSQYEAINSLGAWKEKTNKDLRVLWAYVAIPETYIVRADSGINSIHELDGKPFNPGLRGSASEAMTEALFNELGIQPKYFRGSLGDALESVKDNRIVGLSKSSASPTTPDAALLDLQALTPIKVLTIPVEDLEKLVAKYPHYPLITLKANTYKGQTEDIKTLAQVVLYTATTDMPSDVGYKIVKSIVEGKKYQEEVYPGIKEFDIAQLTIESTRAVPLHAGAVKYFQEIGLKLEPSQIPPEK